MKQTLSVSTFKADECAKILDADYLEGEAKFGTQEEKLEGGGKHLANFNCEHAHSRPFAVKAHVSLDK